MLILHGPFTLIILFFQKDLSSSWTCFLPDELYSYLLKENFLRLGVELTKDIKHFGLNYLYYMKSSYPKTRPNCTYMNSVFLVPFGVFSLFYMDLTYSSQVYSCIFYEFFFYYK